MKHEECPVTRTLEIIGGKWKPLLVFYLAEKPKRSEDLARLIPQASSKMLTQQLRELEKDGIIHRKVYREVPPRVEYSLTLLGKSLQPVMDAMCAWGRTNAKSSSRAE